MAEHLDPETVAAFASGNLSTQERAQAFGHLAECLACREWVAVNAEIANDGIARRRRYVPVWSAVAAGIVCALFAFWLARPHTSREPVVMSPVVTSFGWSQVRLTPDTRVQPPPDTIVLKTTAGDKWIRVDALRVRQTSTRNMQ